jgi:hypothetical protein
MTWTVCSSTWDFGIAGAGGGENSARISQLSQTRPKDSQKVELVKEEMAPLVTKICFFLHMTVLTEEV